MSLNDEDLEKVNNLVVTAVTEAISTLAIPRFDEIEKRLDEHDKRFDKIEARLDAIERDIADLKKDMREVKNRVTNIEGRLEALEADVKELYGMVKKIQQHDGARKSFENLSFEQQLIQVYEDIRAIAHEAGIAMPQ
jgi:septal ring factor EnvC (AmiA/AmiB activator)